MPDLLYEGTEARARHSDRPALPPFSHVPLGFAIVGGLTGATATSFPAEVFNWTSADVVDFVHAPRLVDPAPPAHAIADQADPPRLAQQIEAIKAKSQLTWQQVAAVMRVDARAIHLWRAGGGISAGHEERVHELSALIDSIDTGTPEDVRADLLEPTPRGSLLERLRGGEPPHELALAAPWRAHARESAARNVDAAAGQGILDEDFAFLLYLEPEDAENFAARAEELLESRGTTRRDWEVLLDDQFAAVEQPQPVAVDSAEDAAPDADDGIPPLFSPRDLGIELGVGAIASGRPLHEGR